MSSKQSSISLSINKHKPIQSKEVRNVFGNQSDDEDTAKPQTSAEKFHSKYGNLKAKDERAVNKVLAENPDIYDYDGAYDSIQQKRARVVQEEETSKQVEKKPRYIDNFMNAKKKRDLEKLLRDERKQDKERVTEGDEFKGKEVFVTGAYRKQLEETVKFREELEKTDRIDDLTAVSGQKMWRENFGKKLLEDRVRGRFGDTAEDESSSDQKPKLDKNIKTEIKQSPRHEEDEMEVDVKPDVSKLSTRRPRHDSPDSEEGSRRRRRDSPDRKHRHKEHRHKESKRHRRNNRDRSLDRHHRDRDDRRHKDDHRDRDDRRHKNDRRDRDDRRRSPDRRDHGSRKSYKDAEKEERHQRMQAIRKILRQRNGKRQIEEAKKRYLLRREAGLVVPPV